MQSGSAKYDIYYGGDHIGIDSIGELFDMAVENLTIVKGGAWYTYGETRWQGRDNAIEEIRENEELRQELEKAVG